MSNQDLFTQAKQNYLKTLEQYVPVVDRVHGGNHPEFHEVRSVFNVLVKKTLDAGTQVPELHEEFTKLRAITSDYAVPDDVCESYEAVYQMLEKLDNAYKA